MRDNKTAIELRELVGNFEDAINYGKSTGIRRHDIKERHFRYRQLRSILRSDYPCAIVASTNYEKYGGATVTETLSIGDFSLTAMIEYEDKDCTTCRAIKIRRVRYGDEPSVDGYNYGKVYFDELPRLSEYDKGVLGICQSIQNYLDYIDLSYVTIADCARIICELGKIKSSFAQIHSQECDKTLKAIGDGKERFDVSDFTMATIIRLNFKLEATDSEIGRLIRKQLLPVRR